MRRLVIAVLALVILPAVAGAQIVSQKDRTRDPKRQPAYADITRITVTNGQDRVFVDLKVPGLQSANPDFYYYATYRYASAPEILWRLDFSPSFADSLYRSPADDEIDPTRVKCRGLKAKLLVAKHIVRLSAPHACADVPDYEELTASGSAVGEVVDRHEPDSTVGIVDETQEITVAQGVPSR